MDVVGGCVCVCARVHLCVETYLLLSGRVCLSDEAHRQSSWCVDTVASTSTQTHGSLPRKQSPAHSVAFCSISELGETKAACWLHRNPRDRLFSLKGWWSISTQPEVLRIQGTVTGLLEEGHSGLAGEALDIPGPSQTSKPFLAFLTLSNL